MHWYFRYFPWKYRIYIGYISMIYIMPTLVRDSRKISGHSYIGAHRAVIFAIAQLSCITYIVVMAKRLKPWYRVLLFNCQSHHRGSGSSSPDHHHQPSTDQAQPTNRDTSNTAAAAATAAVPETRSTGVETDIINGNEGHNNFVILSSSPGSAAQRQSQAGLLYAQVYNI